jgi:phytoene dehydrogenase-like protein
MKSEKSMIIIGAGFAGLATGIYARLNGYKTHIFEMHDIPGGLCTSWNRKGYTFDGCIHWLVGSSPLSGMHDMWEETGVSQGREFFNSDEYMRLEDNAGRTLIFYTNADKLEKHLLEFSPQDEQPIKEFIEGIRMCIPFNSPSKHDSLLKSMQIRLRSASIFIKNGKKIQGWMKTTAEDFSKRFSDPLLSTAFREMWIPEFSMFFLLFTFGYLHNKNAGYPIGGSRPMSDALERKYRELGGTISYKSRVSKIITENGQAKGIKLEDGSEHRADRVISAADGHSTIFEMLDGKFGGEKARIPYDKWPIFPSLLYVSLGVDRKFDDTPRTVSGIAFELKEPVQIADSLRDRLSVHVFNQDPTLAPFGKTVLNVMLKSDYFYWKKLSGDRKKYVEKKNEAAATIISLLEQRFPGITGQVEVTDVATPLTFERYTGNWKGTFEGWLITPQNANTIMRPMSQTLPDLRNFYMCGQWVEPGGGLPTGVMSARRLMKKICREDGVKFKTV